MAKLYPIGIQNFEKIRREGYLYIDKTAFRESSLNSLSFSAYSKQLTLARIASAVFSSMTYSPSEQ